MNVHTSIILLSLLSCITTLLGVALALLVRNNKRAIAIGIGFSCGIMVSISLFELIPESYSDLGLIKTFFIVLLGMTLLFSVHLFTPHIHIPRGKIFSISKQVKTIYLIILGLLLHDIAEGFSLANAYFSSHSLGLLVAIGIALHNLAEEFALCVPAVSLGSKKVLFLTAFLSALAEPLGAVFGIITEYFLPGSTAYMLGLAAGAILFVTVHELIPMARLFKRTNSFFGGTFSGFAVHQILAQLIDNHH